MAIGIFTLRQQLRGLLSKNWTGTVKTPYVEYLVVGGGGAGSNAAGGGGGVLTGLLPVTAGATNNVTVGGGAAVSGTYPAGSNSILNSLIAVGGGSGTNGDVDGKPGGSGGGAGYGGTFQPGQGVFGQGNTGGFGAGTTGTARHGGGGGGAGTVGLNATTSIGGNGGAGIASAISGTVTPYGGGGGGGGGVAGGSGGIGGGGAGTTGAGAAGQANTGGGGGGGYGSGGGAGGSGIVIVSYPDVYAPLTTGGATSPTVSTSGSGSVSLNGSSQYLSYPVGALGSGDWTIEFFIYLTSVTTTFYYDGRGSGTSGLQPTIYYSSGAGLKYFTNGGDVINGGTLSSGQWYHIAVSKLSNVTRMFINGTQTGSNYTDNNTYVISTAGNTWVTGNGSFFMNGYMTNMRVLKGTGFSSFTTPTAPLAAVANTWFLLSCVSPNPYLDSSVNGYAVTATASPPWNQSSPFATGLGYKNRVYSWTTTGSGTFTV